NSPTHQLNNYHYLPFRKRLILINEMKMNNRRDFIKKAGALSIALPLMGAGIGCKSGAEKDVVNVKDTVSEAVKSGFTLDEFGIQLWSVRDFMEKDAKGTLKALGEYGYNTIESFQGEDGVFWGMKPKEYATYLSDINLKTISSHCDPQYALDSKKRDEFKKLVDDASEIGMQYLINPYMAFLKTQDEFKKATDGMNELGLICEKNGIQYCYHNHAYSFQPIDGVLPQDIMMDGTKGGPVGFEMDIYWVAAAGADPIAWLKKHPNRFVLSHVKDRYKETKIAEIMKDENVDDKTAVSASCVLGTGQLDFHKILAVAKANGMKRYIVEHERYDDMTSLQAVEKDASYMKQFRV
ncbi:MAG: sugar phosphate isomerase/epimerase, partial [Saprospiraceae bacterium]